MEGFFETLRQTKERTGADGDNRSSRFGLGGSKLSFSLLFCHRRCSDSNRQQLQLLRLQRARVRVTRQLRKLNDEPYGPEANTTRAGFDEGTHSYIGVDSENTEHGRQTKFWGDWLAKEPQAQVQTETPTLAMVQVLQLVCSMVMSYETKVKDHQERTSSIIEALLKTCQKDVDRILALGMQNQR
ncbi:hypothetical protein LTR93_011158 [Exophiala xenobiotica]|nr:hypothetical protein LTR93_011158 [Exophiala xenobiotica]